MRPKIRTILQYALYCALGIQCIFGMLWFVSNIGRVQEFGLGDAYIRSANALLEGRADALPVKAGVLYKLVAGVILVITKYTAIPDIVSYMVLYLGQLASLVFAIKYALDTMRKDSSKKSNRLHILAAFAVISVPEVLQCTLSVMPNSLAAAGILTMGTMAVRGIQRMQSTEETNRKQVAYLLLKLGGLWMAVALLLPEYGFFGLIVMIAFFIGLCRIKKMCYTALLIAVLFPMVTAGIYIGMVSCGRLEKKENAWMLSAVSRFVGPDFQHNHNNWPDEFKAIIDWETAGKVALDTDGTWTVMQPIMREHLSVEECDRIYLKLVKKALMVRKKSIAGSVSLDFLSYLFTPYFVPKQLDGIGGDSFSGRNYEVMKANAPWLTGWYVRYGGFCFFICMIVILFEKLEGWLAGNRKEVEAAKQFKNEKDAEAAKQFKNEEEAEAEVHTVLLYIKWSKAWWILAIVMSIYYTMLGYGRMDYKLSIFMMILWVIRALSASKE